MGKKQTELIVSEGDPSQLRESQIRFLDALEGAMGIVSKAAEACSMSRQAHYEWLTGQVYPETQAVYAARVQEIQDIADDIIENAVLEKVLEGDTTMIIYAARCRLKKRGYAQDNNMFGDQGNAGAGGNTFILQVMPPTVEPPQIIDITPNK